MEDLPRGEVDLTNPWNKSRNSNEDESGSSSKALFALPFSGELYIYYAHLLRSQGKLQDAKALGARAWELLRDRKPIQPLLLSRCLCELGRICKGLGEVREAEEYLAQAKFVLETWNNNESPELAVILFELASLLRSINRSGEAEKHYRRSLHIAEMAPEPPPRLISSVLNGLGLLLMNREVFDEAEVFLGKALSIQKTAGSSSNPLDIAATLSNIARLEYCRGNLAQAEQFYREVLKTRETELGPNHLQVSQTQACLAAVCYSAGNLADAETLFETSLQTQQNILGGDHPDLAIVLDNLAGVHFTNGNLKRAEELNQKALEILEKQKGPNNPDVAISLSNLGKIYTAQGQYTEAISVLTLSIEILETVFHPMHGELLGPLTSLFGVYQTIGNYAAAERTGRRLLELNRRLFGSDHPLLRDIAPDPPSPLDEPSSLAEEFDLSLDLHQDWLGARKVQALGD
ncbi:MAG: tetratricopeptide repeat protein [Candidatus Omnitrophica bacterium COP1]|nr:tetratricopeptide repeat protein [Candidatus Omnitrophica bacterium COP1]